MTVCLHPIQHGTSGICFGLLLFPLPGHHGNGHDDERFGKMVNEVACSNSDDAQNDAEPKKAIPPNFKNKALLSE